MMKSSKANQGFTLIELLVVIGVIAILAAIVLVAVNPGRQFASARDTQRRSDLYSVTNAIYQFAAEHEGKLPAIIAVDGVTITTPFPITRTCIGTGACVSGGTGFDLANAGGVGAASGKDRIVPTYISAIPKDPSKSTATSTEYYIWEDGNGRVVASATGELVTNIQVQR